jgi:hypothetical protein
MIWISLRDIGSGSNISFIPMAKPITIVRVLYDAQEWIVACEDGTFATSRHDTREAAVGTARKHADANRPSLLRVFREDGTLEGEFRYVARV